MALIPEKTTAELAWPRILDALAKETRTPVGRERALALPFLESREAITAHLARVAEARKLAGQALEIPLSDVPDARAHVGRAAREGTLEPVALLECARLMRAANRVRRFLTTRREHAPTLGAEAEGLSEFEPLAAELERAIEPSGAISDNASAELRDLRERARGLHRQVKGRIDDLLRDPEYDEVLRDKYYSIRDDRYVVPVISSFKGRLPGIVHNASQSGQTLFIEPEQLVDLGNQLTIVQAMALEEERRILRDLTDAVGRRAAELEQDTRILAELDRVGAAGRLADLLDAYEPALAEGEDAFELRRLRHPLLVLRGVPVVANDVVLAPGKKGLIVSGPNAGGKTVTLTAVGLCALMARAGLPVPAGPGSKVPLYGAVLTAIGDEGDLSKDLSTFTAHLTALREIARTTVPGTLVCIDEIAADTDPREGAAIASAMLEALVDRGAHVLITTHLDELKAKGLTDERFMAASVGFDFDRLAPTYELRMNVVGASSAIEIARRVGLPERICTRARELLSGSGGSLDRAVAQLERERGEVRRLERALEDERRNLARAREEWDRQRVALEQKRKEVQAGLHREVLDEIEHARADVRRTVARLQKDADMRGAIEAQKELDRAAAAQQRELARAKSAAQALGTGEVLRKVELRPGLRVQVASVGRDGEVLELDGGEALVAIGSLKTRVALADLTPLSGRAKNQAAFRRTKEEQEKKLEQAKAAPVKVEAAKIDVRRMRKDDALRELRAALDRLYQSDTREVFVVHGHGTGALKAAVREELGSSSYAATFRPGEAHEGGDGVTVVAIRER